MLKKIWGLSNTCEVLKITGINIYKEEGEGGAVQVPYSFFKKSKIGSKNRSSQY